MMKTLPATPVAYEELTGLRAELVAHPLYTSLRTLDDVRIFMQHHVFAVWDFMSLLKALQRTLTCVEVPWTPHGNNDAGRFINEIVLGEESDEDGRGGFRSHFEFYLEAMEQCGADTRPICTFIDTLARGCPVEVALDEADVPDSVQQFVRHTLSIASCGKTHRIAAAFFFGREDVIPDMFRALVEDLRREFRGLERLLYYLDRHIEVDADDHGPRAQAILDEICEGNTQRKEEALETARTALQARTALWDGVSRELWAHREAVTGLTAT